MSTQLNKPKKLKNWFNLLKLKLEKLEKLKKTEMAENQYATELNDWLGQLNDQFENWIQF